MIIPWKVKTQVGGSRAIDKGREREGKIGKRVKLQTNPNQAIQFGGKKVRPSTRSTPSRGFSSFQQIEFSTTIDPHFTYTR
ncbi:unnamed protein product [Lactuca virosa]|uniref:Uncharacterized protein n=1 Tax=Lactuca virosa TaxID=75947 RepID=A0AAU9MT29_9ASTR|nr:unnamed protein product [Lactuca virosa]